MLGVGVSEAPEAPFGYRYCLCSSGTGASWVSPSEGHAIISVHLFHHVVVCVIFEQHESIGEVSACWKLVAVEKELHDV